MENFQVYFLKILHSHTYIHTTHVACLRDEHVGLVYRGLLTSPAGAIYSFSFCYYLYIVYETNHILLLRDVSFRYLVCSNYTVNESSY